MTDFKGELRTFQGSFKKDLSYSQIKNPDYSDAFDVRKQTVNGHTTGNVEAIIGNDFAFSVETVSAQNKIYRITPSAGLLDNVAHSIGMFFSDNSISPLAADSFTANFTGTTVANFTSFLSSNIPAGYLSYMTLTTVGSYTQIEITRDIVIVRNDSESTSYTILETQEYIDALETGDLRPMQGDKKGNSAYIISGINSDLPATGYSVGEVGRCTYNSNYNKWTYTRMLRSKEFKLLLTYRPDSIEIESNGDKDSLYWVDDLNVPRVLYCPTIDSTVSLDSSKTVLVADSPELVDFTKILPGAKISLFGELKTVLSTTQSTIQVTSDFSEAFQQVVIDVQDICLSYICSSGVYEYGQINKDTSHFVNIPPPIVSDVTEASGGSVKSGGKRYVVRGVTADLIEGAWGRPSFEINVFSSPNTFDTLGDPSGTVTGKRNVVTVAGIDTSVYSYIDVARLEYDGISVSGTIFKRISVSSSTVILNDLGETPDSSTLDINTLIDVGLKLETAKCNLILDNRYILANGRTAKAQDLSDLALTITHSIGRSVLPYTPNAEFNFGEYMNPQNVFGFGSFMVSETYRFGLRVLFANGTVGNYWIDDIRIDTSATNITAGEIYNNTSLTNRRTGTVPDVDITDSDGNPYSYYIDLSIDLNSTDTSAIQSLEIVRYPMDTVREVLATGIALPTIKVYYSPVIRTGDTVSGSNIITNMTTTGLVVDMYVSDAEGNSYGQITLVTLTTIHISTVAPVTATGVTFDLFYSLGQSNGFDVRRPFPLQFPMNFPNNLDINVVTMYAPDILHGNTNIQFQSGDTLKVIETQIPYNIDSLGNSRYLRETGDFSSNGDTDFLPDNIIVGASQVTKLSQGTVSASPTAIIFQNFNTTIGSTPSLFTGENAFVISLTTPISPTLPTGINQKPVFYVQYFRGVAHVSPNDCKFGNVVDSVYESFGAVYTGQLFGTISIRAYGNDVFTQNNWFKQVYPNKATGYTETNSGGGHHFPCQNIGNIQMHSWQGDSSSFRIYPAAFALGNVQGWLEYQNINGTTILQEEYSYDPSYNYNTIVQREVNYNPALVETTKLITAIWWSQPKPQNGKSDNYRQIPVGNVKYLSNTDGEIVSIHRMGNELYTRQNFGLYRQYFNTRGTISTTDASEAVLGGGSVMNRDGIRITTFGGTQQHAAFIGQSNAGDDTLFYYDDYSRKIMRLAGNGITAVSDTGMLSKWLHKNAQWATKDQTAFDWGVHGAFNTRWKEAVFTFRGQKVVQDYDVKEFSQGEAVLYSTPFENNPYDLSKTIYIAKTDGMLSPPTGLVSDANWQFAELSNPDYYSWFTVVYSEVEQGFVTYHTPVPRIYIPFSDSYMTPSALISASGDIYMHDKGVKALWWDDLVGNPYIEYPSNSDEFFINKFISTTLQTTSAPYRMDFQCLSVPLKTYLEQSEFKDRVGKFVSPIKNDSTVTGTNPSGLNSTRAANMKSDKLLVKYSFGTSNDSQVLTSCFIFLKNLYRKPNS